MESYAEITQTFAVRPFIYGSGICWSSTSVDALDVIVNLLL